MRLEVKISICWSGTTSLLSLLRITPINVLMVIMVSERLNTCPLEALCQSVRALLCRCGNDLIFPLNLALHCPHTSRSQSKFDTNDFCPIGENIAAGTLSGRTFATGYQGLSQLWADELQFWSPPNTCQAGKVCGHYTQIVWNATTLVGCGYTQCSTLTGVTWNTTSLYVVCDYARAGNVIGSNPYVAPPPPPSAPSSDASSTDPSVLLVAVVSIFSLWLSIH